MARFAFHGLAVLLACAAMGCSNTPPSQAPDPGKAFPPSTPSDDLLRLSSGPASTDLDIYIDDSGSMRGFVTNADSNFRSVLRSLLLAATSTQLSVHVFPLSADRSITATPLSVVESPGFYHGKDTPLAALLRKVAGRPSHMAILVSDLVLSERSADVQTLEAALSNLAQQTPTMKLLAFRSDFDGTYYPESQSLHGSSYQARTTQRVPGEGRPFYLLTVAPNPASMQVLNNYLFNRVVPVNSFDPTQPAFEVQKIVLKSSSKDESSWKGVHKFELPNPDARQFSSAYELVKGPATENTPAGLPLEITVRTHIPLMSVDAVELSGRRVTWKDRRLGAAEETHIKLKGSLSKDATTLNATLSVPAPSPRSWDYYRLILQGGKGNLAVPDWVHDWSTDDDSHNITINRTFQLETLVQTMENTISERQFCGEWLLKIGRGN